MVNDSNGSIAIAARGLKKRFGDHVALDGLSLEVRTSEVVVVLGPSGSGKSTFLYCCNGLVYPDDGEIHIAGTLLDARHHEVHKVRAEVGMVFQQFNLFPHLTVAENVAIAPRVVRHESRPKALERAEHLLEQVGLTDKRDSYPAHLSGGQKQRVAIARTLALEPKIILFDEPTSALDPEMIGEVLDTMRDLAGGGITMVVVTHEIGFAREVADRVVFIDEGRVIEQNTPTEMIDDPQTDRAREFFRKAL